jgi:uncharacterized protein
VTAIELTPVVPPGRQIIERYGAHGFRVSGVIHPGAVLVFPQHTLAWETTDPAAITFASLAPVVAHGGLRILLLGMGRRMCPVAAELRAALRDEGIALEAMDTGAACRTFNVLLGEDRLVAAALLPP